VFRHVFETPGTYHYICRDHVNFGMVGSVVVTPR
jgi:plastocyanin